MSEFVIEGAVDMQTADSTGDRFKIAITGEPGSGKSWLAASCATIEEPAFHFDFDGRRQSIAGKPYITSKTYQDVDYPNRVPTAWSGALTDLMRMEQAYQDNKLPYKWFIADSATFMSVSCLNNIMYATPSLRRNIVAAGRTTYIPLSFDTYKAEMSEIIGFLSRLMAMGNVIMCFHLGNEKDLVNSTKTESKYTNNLAVIPPRYNDLLALFNDQWLISAKGPNQYEVTTKPNYVSGGFWTGKTTLQIKETEQPDIRAMLQKHMSVVKK
jgi:hypothetical protein